MEKRIYDITPMHMTLVEKKRVAAYARVSCDKDTMLHSLAAQIDYYRKLIIRNPEWEFAGVYADEAKTGTKENREQFQMLLAACRSGLVDMIIVKSISRLARNTVTLLATVRELKELGINIYFEEYDINSISEEGELMLTLLASQAQEESLACSENCKWYWRQRMQDGHVVGLRRMFGYDIKHGVITIDPIEAAMVRSVFERYIAGESTISIARMLENSGMSTVSGGRWSDSRVRDMLKNEKYAGNSLLQKKYVSNHLTKQLVRNHGELTQYFVEGTHDAIIDRKTFERAQQRMALNAKKRNVHKPNTTRYPFSGKVVCGNCGKHFGRKTTNGYISWQCLTFRFEGKSACPAKQIPEPTLLALCCDVLGIPQFDERIFTDRIREMRVTAPNEVEFLFSDGHTETKIWKDHSRRESWTEEMREAARQRLREKRKDVHNGK